MRFTVKDEPFAVGYAECESESVSMKIACGMLRQAQDMPLQIRFDWKLAGMSHPDLDEMGKQGVFYRFGESITVRPEKLLKKAETCPEKADEYRELHRIFVGLDTQHLVDEDRARTPKEKKLIDNNTLWGGRWGGHCNIDFGYFVREGTERIRAKITRCRRENPGKDEWYEASDIAMRAMEVLGERYRELALAEEKDAPQGRKYVYRRIAKALETVPRHPATDFFSAVQSFYLLFSFDGIDSPGWFDQYMYDYYKTCERAEAREILEGLWNAFHHCRAWNLCVGGSDENGNDLTNELSYEILDVTTRSGFQTPNLTLRWHRNTSDAFLKKAAECIATGCGLPALYNDEAVCPALERAGIPAADAHQYAMNGCNQIDIQGKSHMGLEDGEVYLLKCLEYALFDGVDLLTGERVSIQTGDAAEFDSYDRLWQAFAEQVRYATKLTVDFSNRSQKIYGEYGPNPLRSAVLQGCLEKGKDYACGGALYNHGQILTEGLADTADSLCAIRHFVFETKEITMRELLDALKTDFAGREALRLRLWNYSGKFGNDNDEADEIAVAVQKLFFGEIERYTTWRDPENGRYGGGLSTFQRTGRYGRAAGASANGRHSQDIYIADCIGAVPGLDRHGPTAALCSAMKYDHSMATSGFVMQLKFDKKLFRTEAGIRNFMGLVKGYFMGGGQQLSVNVLDEAELLDAQLHPERHQNLIVRVGGYSDYFNNLSRDLQDNVIARSVQN